MSDPYIPRREAEKSWRPATGSHMSPGLLRAREPFRLRNALTGIILGGFAVGIWAYSMGAVKQDVFEDADEEARRLARSGVEVKSLEDEERERKAAVEGKHESVLGDGELARGVVASASAAAAAAEAALPSPPPPTPENVPAPVKVTEARTNAPASRDRPRGVVASLLYEHYPQALDPQTKTVLWGAPSVDNIGKLRDRALPSRK